ncbi:MAG: hypothetical protein KGK16_01800 [Bradyrhizobium sp.]|nr:hypothetical protein [Bradyrhizobium sp.]
MTDSIPDCFAVDDTRTQPWQVKIAIKPKSEADRQKPDAALGGNLSPKTGPSACAGDRCYGSSSVSQ